MSEKPSLNSTILQIQVNAQLSGHQLSTFDPIPDQPGKYQATCLRCHKTVYVEQSGLMYSLLGDTDCIRPVVSK